MSPSAYVTAYVTKTGKKRYRVEYRLGGRAAKKRHGGSFRTEAMARARKQAIEASIARGEDPRLTVLAVPVEAEIVTVAVAAERWQASRHDVTEQTAKRHKAQLAYVLKQFGTRAPESITPAEVSAWIGQLAAGGMKPDYVRKVVNVLAMVLGHHGLHPNPVRDERVRLPRRRRKDVDAPETEVLLSTFDAMPPRYVFASVVLETTAMRVGDLESLIWADIDAPRNRVRVNIGGAKTEAGGRWVPVPEDVMAAIESIVPREDRDLERRVLPWFDQAAYRSAIRRAVTATGSARWTPHGLRRRRISLWHRAGISWAQIGEWAGQRDLSVTANTYTRVMVGEELDRGPLLARWPAREGVRA